jgi:hypothetical protein
MLLPHREAATLNLIAIIFALMPCTNQYNMNPISFIDSNNDVTNIIALDLTKCFNSFTKYINVP